MADSDLINDELERVYRLYGERTRSFRRGLYALIVASLALFVLIVVPFLTFRDQLAAMQDHEAALLADIEEARSLIAMTKASITQARDLAKSFDDYYVGIAEHAAIEEMAREAEAHADILDELKSSFARSDDPGTAAWVKGEARQPPPEIVATNRRLFGFSQDACNWDSGLARLTCRLCASLTRENERVLRRIVQSTAAPYGSVEQDLNIIVARSCAWLTEGEPHWDSEKTLSSVMSFPRDIGVLLDYFNLDLYQYRDRLRSFQREQSEWLAVLQVRLERLQRQRAELSERLATLEGQLGRIASFDRIGTPAGDVPIGLGQIVLLFPVVLAAGFLIVANGYARSAELQHAFVRLCRKRDATGEVMDARHIAAIAPLWLDRRDPLGARLAKWAILLTPLALTLANLGLIATTRALTDQLPDDAVIPPVAYLLLYAASLALFAGTLWYIWRSGQEEAPEATAAQEDDGGS
jgi:hypothetical protein